MSGLFVLRVTIRHVKVGVQQQALITGYGQVQGRERALCLWSQEPFIRLDLKPMTLSSHAAVMICWRWRPKKQNIPSLIQVLSLNTQ